MLTRNAKIHVYDMRNVEHLPFQVVAMFGSRTCVMFQLCLGSTTNGAEEWEIVGRIGEEKCFLA